MTSQNNKRASAPTKEPCALSKSEIVMIGLAIANIILQAGEILVSLHK